MSERVGKGAGVSVESLVKEMTDPRTLWKHNDILNDLPPEVTNMVDDLQLYHAQVDQTMGLADNPLTLTKAQSPELISPSPVISSDDKGLTIGKQEWLDWKTKTLKGARQKADKAVTHYTKQLQEFANDKKAEFLGNTLADLKKLKIDEGGEAANVLKQIPPKLQKEYDKAKQVADDLRKLQTLTPDINAFRANQKQIMSILDRRRHELIAPNFDGATQVGTIKPATLNAMKPRQMNTFLKRVQMDLEGRAFHILSDMRIEDLKGKKVSDVNVVRIALSVAGLIVPT